MIGITQMQLGEFYRSEILIYPKLEGGREEVKVSDTGFSFAFLFLVKFISLVLYMLPQ